MPKSSIYLLFTGYPIKCPRVASNQLYNRFILSLFLQKIEGDSIKILFIWYFAERSQNAWDYQNVVSLELSYIIYNPNFDINAITKKKPCLCDISPKDHEIYITVLLLLFRIIAEL